jgi:asparagine synthase (glutamine-hydrolysing)
MQLALYTRGPDGTGNWLSPQEPLGFAHRRLAIVDLSPTGVQPMTSASGRFTIVFNGEVYNFQEIKKELTDYQFLGTSDTEVLLAAFERWGVRDSLPRFNGMFAIGVWDSQERTLHLIRDRFGVKPLYCGLGSDRIAFASELKAFETCDLNRGVNQAAVNEYVRFGYVPAPLSIFCDIWKLPPGSILSIPIDAIRKGNVRDLVTCSGGQGTIRPVQWWSSIDEASSYRCLASGRDKLSVADLDEQLLSLLRDSVRLRMISDVPLGAFLSGGIDSSLVVSLMQEQASQAVRTFSIGFREGGYNEAPYAAEVAAALGTAHTEFILEPKDALEIVPKLSYWYDEPFADASEIPTLLVSHLARQHVTVALSGDGGDEFFAGYLRYALGERLWHLFGRFPVPIRRLVARAAGLPSAGFYDQVFRGLSVLVPRIGSFRHPGMKLHKGVRFLASRNIESLYRKQVSLCQDPDHLLVGTVSDMSPWYGEDCESRLRGGAIRATDVMRLLDALTYLPDQILVKVDRATMANSLEAREPLLDYRLFRLGWQYPTEALFDANGGKAPLRRVLARYLPPSVFQRPKQGFSVPIASWLRGPLKSWAMDSVEDFLRTNQPWYRPEAIRNMLHEHTTGQQNHESVLWSLLTFMQWCQQWKII